MSCELLKLRKYEREQFRVDQSTGLGHTLIFANTPRALQPMLSFSPSRSFMTIMLNAAACYTFKNQLRPMQHQIATPKTASRDFARPETN